MCRLKRIANGYKDITTTEHVTTKIQRRITPIATLNARAYLAVPLSINKMTMIASTGTNNANKINDNITPSLRCDAAVVDGGMLAGVGLRTTFLSQTVNGCEHAGQSTNL